MMDVEAIPDHLMKDVAASLFVRDPVVEEEQSDFETGYYDSEGEYWPLQVNDDLMTKTDNEKFAEKKETKVIKIESDSSSDDDAAAIPPVQLFTLPANVAGRNYVGGVPYELFETASASKKACLDPAPVIGLDGKAIHLYFEIASWDVMWNGLNAKTKAKHEELVASKMKKDKLTRKHIENSGPPCSGITLQVGDYWYSLVCLYASRRNVATTGPQKTRCDGLQAVCRGCMAHHNTLHVMLRRTFDPETALNYKANNLIGNKEWSRKVTHDISYSIVLRVLRNGGFIYIRTQEDIDWIRTTLTPEEQQDHLDWILANRHYGFRTGSELVLLAEAGMNMISFDRTISFVTRAGVKVKKPIDSIGQTIISDSWAFNRLSNELDEDDTDALIEFLLAGNYAFGDAAFERRNGAGQRDGLLSQEWEQSIVQKWNSMSVEARTEKYNSRRTGPVDPNLILPDIRIWTLAEFQRICRLNANAAGNLVDEITGVELTPSSWGVDRVINGIVPAVSGEYRNTHCIITHQRLNDMKESGGRKVFASVETLNLEKQRRNIVEQDDRLATIIILRDYLDHIRIFRSSDSYHYNMHRLKMKKLGVRIN